jgi:ribosomal protein S18 acetylase RimI-like enzyme
MSNRVEILTKLKRGDNHDLCEAAESAIRDGGGFGWLTPPSRNVLETYWKGVLLVPERTLYVARLDDVICGSAQLLRPTRNNEAQAATAQLQASFIAPWARGHGLARALTLAVEQGARAAGFAILTLDVRATQDAAIALYESLDYIRWGTNPRYALVDGAFVAGHHYYKDLASAPAQETTSAAARAPAGR